MRRVRVDAYDVLAAAGLGCLAYGLWLVAPWIAFAAVGVVLLAMGVMGAMWKGRR